MDRLKTNEHGCVWVRLYRTGSGQNVSCGLPVKQIPDSDQFLNLCSVSLWEGNTAAFEGFEGTSSYLCRLLSYLSFKTPCEGNHLRSCAVYFTYINSLYDHNSEVDSGVPALTPSISPGKMSRSAESQTMNNMAYRRREGEGQLLETSGPL